MTNKAVFAGLIMCGLLLSALVARNGQLLMLAMPFLVYLIVGILQSPGRLSLRATRTLDRAEAYAGEPVRVCVVVENMGEPVGNLWLADTCPEGIRPDGRYWQHAALASGASSEIEYTVTGSRG